MAVDTLNPGIARRFRGKCRQSQDPEFSAQRRSIGIVADLPFAPVDLEGAAALAALARLFAHWTSHANSEQFNAVRELRWKESVLANVAYRCAQRQENTPGRTRGLF